MMRIGFLHLGPPEHGVSRYGRLLAAGARKVPGLEVREIDLARVEPAALAAQLPAALERLGTVDVIHLQHNRALVGEGAVQQRNLAVLRERARAPIVANLHDVYVDDPWAAFRKRRPSMAQRFERLRREWTQLRPERQALREFLQHACAVVCFECEAQRLRKLVGGRRGENVRVIGHFVEPRTLPDRDVARRALGVGDAKVVTLAGYIHRRKGHDLLVEALPALPSDVLVVFAGAATEEHARYLAELESKAKRAGVRDRLHITGYLDEATLDNWLAATDLAVCPFRFFSASGSIATWIAAGRTVLCHRLPQIDEYRRIAPDTFPSFDDYTAESLSAAIRRELERGVGRPSPGMQRLADEFSLPRTVARHVDLYRSLAP